MIIYIKIFTTRIKNVDAKIFLKKITQTYLKSKNKKNPCKSNHKLSLEKSLLKYILRKNKYFCIYKKAPHKYFLKLYAYVKNIQRTFKLQIYGFKTS